MPVSRFVLGWFVRISRNSLSMLATVSSGSRRGRLQFVGKNSTVLLILMLLVIGM